MLLFLDVDCWFTTMYVVYYVKLLYGCCCCCCCIGWFHCQPYLQYWWVLFSSCILWRLVDIYLFLTSEQLNILLLLYVVPHLTDHQAFHLGSYKAVKFFRFVSRSYLSFENLVLFSKILNFLLLVFSECSELFSFSILFKLCLFGIKVLMISSTHFILNIVSIKVWRVM